MSNFAKYLTLKDNTVVYFADGNLRQSIATVDSVTATAAHAVNDYILVDGQFYKVTTAIAIGDTIAAGTNVQATTIMAAINSAATLASTVTELGTQGVTSAGIYSFVTSTIADVKSTSFQVVESLPATGEGGIIYLMANNGAGNNVYDEYIWVTSTNSFELLGTLSTDLSDYVTFTLLNRALTTVAPVETTSAASRDYAVGDYLIAYDGTAKTWNFYKVTTAIATAATIAAGTNVTAVTVASELKALATTVAGLTFDAAHISYDATTSGLAAANVQAAIDELANEKLDNDVIASTTDLGLIKASSSVNVANDGTATVPAATTSAAGIVQIDSAVTANSDNVATSGAVATAIADVTVSYVAATESLKIG